VARLRLAELEESAQILQVSAIETLGYHDSGMLEWEYKARPDAFCNVPVETVAGRIAELIDKYRPQVLVTYDDEGAYQHPDHVHASKAAQAAAAASGIPVKVYLSTMKGSSWRKIFDALRELGEDVPNWDNDSPEAQERAARALESEARITTTVDIRDVLARKRAALFAHGSQINDSWFSKLPASISEEAFGYEYFIRVADSTGAPLPETDLFAGLRTGA
jgi:LmbE family N-acetylglucosaminyl deacetylase